MGLVFRNKFEEMLRSAINENSRENVSNTPDFLLADYLIQCLHTFDEVINRRELFFGREEANPPRNDQGQEVGG